MSDAVVLLRSGKEVPHLRCDCCSRYARALSERGWCGACEHECTEVGQRVRARLELMRAREANT